MEKLINASNYRGCAAARQPDTVLVGHPQGMFAGTALRRRAAIAPPPNGADAWTRQLAVAEADFEQRVRAE